MGIPLGRFFPRGTVMLKDFRPFVAASENIKEFSLGPILMGIVLGILLVLLPFILPLKLV